MSDAKLYLWCPKCNNAMGEVSVDYSAAQPERRPHKCPVCEGSGQKPVPTAPHEQERTIPCHACTNGIVWEPAT